ncbi:MAG: group II truncated hemoglobin [Proteobacteria bacterium]|nr:group II truncated hemoglobin [Pseudomonadota bacterium]
MAQQTADTDTRQYGDGDCSFQSAGGETGIKKLVETFYHKMDTLPEAKTIRDMHPEDLTVSIDKLYRFLVGWLGGPKLFHEKYGPIKLPVAHSKFPIGLKEKHAWLLCMQKALEEQPYKEDFKEYLMEQLSFPATKIQNRD